jgi:hypothetical protein
MFEKRIDLIHNYCDRWCERCAFTDRCSVYATEVAIAMCGDARAGIELAMGDPQPVGEARREPDYLPLPDDEDDEDEDEDDEDGEPAAQMLGCARDNRPLTPLESQSREYMFLAVDWTREHCDAWHERGDAVLRDALEVVSWDAALIGAKVHRALFSRALRIDEEEADDPVQNDANGSAKVALISLERTEAAWGLIANATGDAEAAALGRSAGTLRELLAHEFPEAMSFTRPGFDEEPSSTC